MQKLVRTLDCFSYGVGSVVRWLALAMVLVQFMVVVARYVFGLSDVAVNESVLYMHSTLFMLGAGYTLLVNGHVRVDIFYNRLGDTGRRRIDLFGHLFLLMPTMFAILYWSWPAVVNSWSILEGPISVGGIKAVFILKTLIPAFCILLLIQSASEVLRLLIGGKARD
ncbi:TRAP-type mannitol/chloroaromatic compound transport system, small permease component [Ruegeria halocynthiae]|uniref:TRAP transporter small permease protein n=1 Tax=Ruegeria halocynthiae TaxID=985054 RepID=A0A1H3G2V5_9RHOB|nr:TRAP transporter small permease subunit [Ruegeria halocynthiae]SDX97591.1 TRAP-type mannitol/chloroaromatic compound transport system, small permease component [Ruegeria halocynthiae]